jgi:hypothetical protein
MSDIDGNGRGVKAVTLVTADENYGDGLEK